MNELQKKVESMRQASADRAAENRKRMPVVASVVDDFRGVFGDVKVIHAKENGIEMGRPGEDGIRVCDTVIGSMNLRMKK